jgi:hypothetical protein
MKKKYKLRRVSYSYHPDFIEDPTVPCGYRCLDTGRWVVEWDLWSRQGAMWDEKTHYARSFLTEEQAQRFADELEGGMVEGGYVFADEKAGDIYFGDVIKPFSAKSRWRRRQS